ncbi:MAG: DUF1385 domain-containing protein [Acidobacteria bacterium]|nr:DUF1385 domain-containing protein [Acidobacteriota bacterium]
MSVRRYIRLAAHTQLLPVLESGEETTLIGGQAVMEGVMMRSPQSYCVAVRKPDGEIITISKPLAKVADRYPIFKYPLLRGLGTLGQAMKLGIEALQFSANAALTEEEKSKAGEKGGDAGGAEPKPISGWVMGANLAFSLLFFFFLYKFVPLWLTTQMQKSLPQLSNQILFNLVDGVIRIVIFLAFLYGISRWKDIHRVFEFHGAEHRVVFNFESGKPVTVPTAQSFVTFHPRCGTSFLIVVMLISMCIYALLPFQDFVSKFVSRILLMPVIAGLSYEIIRFAAKRPGSLLSLMTAPGLWLQRITTQTPADDQTEVAIVALEGAMELERQQGGKLVIA